MRRQNRQYVRAGGVLALAAALAFGASQPMQRKAEAQAIFSPSPAAAQPLRAPVAPPVASPVILAIAVEVDQQDRCLLNLPATALVISKDAADRQHKLVRKPVACG